MTTRIGIVGLCCAAVMLATPAAAVGQARPDSLPPGVTMAMVEQGSALFQGRGLCANCHGAAASGFLGPDLTDAEWLQAKGSYLDILQVVLSGVSEEQSTQGVAMPPRGSGTLSDVDVQAVAAYVWALSHPEEARRTLPPGVTQAMVNRGRLVFEGPGQCVRCHGADAGGQIGPNLTDAAWLHAKGSYLDIVGAILNGVPLERSTRGIPMPPRGGSNLTEDEVNAVAAYVWYVSHQN